MKQSFKLAQKQYPEGLFHRIRKSGQEFNITDHRLRLVINSSMFGDPDQLFHQFCLLMNSGFQKRLTSQVVTFGTMIGNMFINLIDLIQGKRLTMRPVVSGLGWFNDVGRRRFGGIRGIFRELGELFEEFLILFDQKYDFLFQIGDPCVSLSHLDFQVRNPLLINFFLGRFHRPVLISFYDRKIIGRVKMFNENMIMGLNGYE